jgi:hypothetical protein
MKLSLGVSMNQGDYFDTSVILIKSVHNKRRGVKKNRIHVLKDCHVYRTKDFYVIVRLPIEV